MVTRKREKKGNCIVRTNYHVVPLSTKNSLTHQNSVSGSCILLYCCLLEEEAQTQIVAFILRVAIPIKRITYTNMVSQTKTETKLKKAAEKAAEEYKFK